ncbi:MAG: DUF192 domain-containing protein [Ignavibacteria bacterium]
MREEADLIKTGELFFLRGNTTKVISKINVEISDEEDGSEKGMMYRDHISDDKGMLFILKEYTERCFWMKNTSVPLDIIFADSSKQIFRIYKDTKPFSEELLSSGRAVKYAVEVSAGYCKRNMIGEGDTFIFNDLNGPPQEFI